MLVRGATVGKKLWLLTGGAIAAVIVFGLLGFVAPPFQSYSFLAFMIVSGIWAATSLLVLLTEARRIHKLLVVIAILLAVALSFTTRWFGFAGFLLGYFGAIVFVGMVLVLAIVRVFRKRPRLRALLFPLTMIMAGTCGVLLSAWSSRPVTPLPAQPMSTSDEIKYIHDTDQSDRASMYIVMDQGRDRIRLERVKALYRAGKITKAMDQYNAAMVYQHASCADDFEVAYELARAAEDAHGAPEFHPPLSHLAYDRWQLALGKNQTYGTQLFPMPIKRPCPHAQ